jgi:drug/metabolite transporter (DMT)-like permease
VLVLAAVVCESLFLLLNKRLRTPAAPLLLATLMCAWGMLLCAVPALLEWVRLSADPPATAWWAVAWYAVVPTVLGFVAWYAGARRVTGTEAALFTALVPLSALAIGVTLMGESLGWLQACGAALVLLGIGVGTFTAGCPGAKEAG